MALYKVPDPNDEIECPYDKTHMIRAKRFPYHLIKCRKNRRGFDYATCPFNARHEVPRPELRYHISRCPDSSLIYKDVMYDQSKNEEDPYKGNTTVPNYQSDRDNHHSEENWDDEAPPTEAIMFYGKKMKTIMGADPMIEFTSDPPGRPAGPQFRLPAQAPKVLEAAKVKANTKAPKPTVYSLMVGVGRGRGMAQNKTAAVVGASGQNQVPQQPGKVKPTMSNPRMAANIFGNNQTAAPQDPTVTSTNEDLAESLTALSRGRGSRMMARAPVVGVLANGIADSPDHSPARPGDSPEVVRQKEIRKLAKKLRAIEVTEQKGARGEILDADEIEKISQKKEILTELTELSI